jgi:hypothetical protein
VQEVRPRPSQIAAGDSIWGIARHFCNDGCKYNKSTPVEAFRFAAHLNAKMQANKRPPPLTMIVQDSQLGIDLDQTASQKLSWIELPGEA